MNPRDLLNLLKGHKVYIQTHNFPDPDAIASGYGLQQLLKYHNINSVLCYDGKIDKLSTKKMMKVFNIHALSKEELGSMKNEDYIVTVDAQKNNSNLTNFSGKEIACIDHHPIFKEWEYEYSDIRIVGACSTLIAEYFIKTNTPIDTNTASVLAYGIKMDTADFIRGTCDLDVDMFSYLYKKADPNKLASMYTNNMELKDLYAYGAAIKSIKICEKIGFASIPFECADALIAMISDFIISLDVVEASVVYAKRQDGIKFSIRSEMKEVNAGLFTEEALKGYGNGGGHFSMAGGFIPKENESKLGASLEEKIRELFLEALTRYK